MLFDGFNGRALTERRKTLWLLIKSMCIVYPPVITNRELDITKLHSLYYFRLIPGDPLAGEAHDFWEMVYIDVGEALIRSDKATYHLRQGDVFFHAPNSFHQIILLPQSNPSILIASFSVNGERMKTLENRKMTASHSQKNILSALLAEGVSLYGPLLDCHRDLSFDRLENAPFGALQLIVDYLEVLLIGMIRAGEPLTVPSPANNPAISREEIARRQTDKLIGYMHEHLSDGLSFSDCSDFAGLSKTTLKALFRKHYGVGVMHYYQWLRVNEARQMLRSGKLNVSEVALELGYSSCQAFSTQFHRILGTTPTAYLRSVASAPETIIKRKQMPAALAEMVIDQTDKN